MQNIGIYKRYIEFSEALLSLTQKRYEILPMLSIFRVFFEGRRSPETELGMLWTGSGKEATRQMQTSAKHTTFRNFGSIFKIEGAGGPRSIFTFSLFLIEGNGSYQELFSE